MTGSHPMSAVRWAGTWDEIPGIEREEAGRYQDMDPAESGTPKAKTHAEARALLDDAWARATKVYKESKEQADIVYDAAKKIAVDKEARKRADEAHKEAVKEAKKASDAITSVALAGFGDFWKQQDIDSKSAIHKSEERADLAKKAYKGAKKEADLLHEEAKRTATGGLERKQADEARSEAMKRAKKVYDETGGK
jgi:hypothetical protein